MNVAYNYLSRSPRDTERCNVPLSPPSDRDPSNSGSTEPARGLLRLLREPREEPNILGKDLRR